MRPDLYASRVAAVSVAMTIAVSVWGVSVDPGRGLRWLAIAAFLPTLWAYVEFAQVRGHELRVGRAIMTVHRWSIAWVGLMLSSQVGLRLAIHSGLVSELWLPAGRRISGLILGVGMVLFGNALPTLQSPWPLRLQPFAWQHVHRFVGWVFVLSGLSVVICWAWLPLDSASQASQWILGTTVALALGRKVLSLLAHSSPHAQTP